jgi:ribonuclease P protein component
VIWRVRDRHSFERLRHEGRRVRTGVLWCTYVADPALSPPRVAYAIGRAVGPAVDRNRLRRRLRALLAAAPPAPGLYLIGVQPHAVGRSSSELMFDLRSLFNRLDRAAWPAS